MGHWEQVLSKVENSGLFTPDAISAAEVVSAARKSKLAFLHLDLAGVDGKPALMKAVAKAFGFPKYSGANWDALEDCLTDFSWNESQGYVLLIENSEKFAENVPTEMDTACSIFRSAADYWKGRDIGFFVLLEGRGIESASSKGRSTPR